MKDIFEYIHQYIVNMGVSDVGLAYVLAILVFTLIIRLLILPFNIKSANSTRGMQKLQPELKKLQDKYKDDKEKLGAETMKLYKENNVNPAGGCLPALLPLPILMALYWVFMGIQDIEGASFLWIHDLFSPDKYYILPILAALSTYLPSYLMTKSTPAQTQPGGMNMGTMNLMMAGMMGFMSLNFKAILVLYWIIGNLIQTIQTYFLNYRPAMKEVAMENEAKEVAEKPFMAVEQPKNSASKKKKK
jgi:YidC/Oxa1 family membrane protein insertase